MVDDSLTGRVESKDKSSGLENTLLTIVVLGSLLLGALEARKFYYEELLPNIAYAGRCLQRGNGRY